MGAYGWCYESNEGSRECYGPNFGYRWDPQLIRWLVKGLITIGIGELASRSPACQGQRVPTTDPDVPSASLRIQLDRTCYTPTRHLLSIILPTYQPRLVPLISCEPYLGVPIPIDCDQHTDIFCDSFLGGQGLTALTTIIAFVFATILFHNGRIRFENAGVDAGYG